MSLGTFSRMVTPRMQGWACSTFQCPTEYLDLYIDSTDIHPKEARAFKRDGLGNVRQREKDWKRSRLIQMNNSNEIPQAICHYCSQNCENGPLICCDLCRTAFHIDCLECGFHSQRSNETWICPLHTEHVVNELFPTKSITTRSHYVKKYAQCPINEEEVAKRFRTLNRNPAPQPITISPYKVPKVVKNVYTARGIQIRPTVWPIKMPDEDIIPKKRRLSDGLGTNMIEISKMCHRKLKKKEYVVNSLLDCENVLKQCVGAYLLFFERPGHVTRFYPIESVIDIGTEESCIVRLDRLYPSCLRISEVHASVFYDASTGSYELVNYSQYGTFVDEINYCNGHSGEAENAHECICGFAKEFDMGIEGNEESAILFHGSSISIGCGHFVLAIVPSI